MTPVPIRIDRPHPTDHQSLKIRPRLARHEGQTLRLAFSSSFVSSSAALRAETGAEKSVLLIMFAAAIIMGIIIGFFTA